MPAWTVPQEVSVHSPNSTSWPAGATSESPQKPPALAGAGCARSEARRGELEQGGALYVAPQYGQHSLSHLVDPDLLEEVAPGA